MPKFTRMEPSDVLIGRARSAAAERAQYVEAVSGSDAGKIELGRGENPSRVKRLLSEAAREAGTKVRSSWRTSRSVSCSGRRSGASTTRPRARPPSRLLRRSGGAPEAHEPRHSRGSTMGMRATKKPRGQPGLSAPLGWAVASASWGGTLLGLVTPGPCVGAGPLRLAPCRALLGESAEVWVGGVRRELSCLPASLAAARHSPA